jgi:hypothetical protein
MPTNSQVIYDDSEYKYSFSFNNSDADYIKIYLKIMEDIYEESKAYLYILIVVLLLFSIIGTVSNLFTFFLFKFIFNKNFNRKIQSNLAAVVAGKSKRGTRNRLISTNNAKEHEEVGDEDEVIFNHYYEDEGDNKAIKLHVNFDKIKKKLIFSSNLRVFYTLIRYLALVDLFTCSFAIPVTVYEIWYNMKINEFYCKLFEFMRSFGILLSNFLIVLIAIERYNALTNLRNIKKIMFRIRISFVIIISILFGLVCSLQVSVYQKFDGTIIYTGVCMLSDSVSHLINKIVTISITILFLFCIILLTIIYIFLFKRIFELNSRYRMRKEAINRIFKNSIQYTRQDNLLKESTTNSKNFSNEFQIKKRGFNISRNLRLAIIILIVTFIYYLSIIPWCLTINGFIQYNPYIHYSFLLNNSVNPLVYGILNPNFRKCGLYLIKLIINFILKKICQLFRSSE